MTFGVFIHRTDSIYDDVPSERYQFPRQYLSRAEQCVDDWIVYLEPSKVKNSKGYFAVAKIQEIIPDPRAEGMYIAIVQPGTYLDFGNPVAFNQNGFIVEQGLLNDAGRISGRAQAAVRTLSSEDFSRIVGIGLGDETDVLPRTDDPFSENGFREAPEIFEHFDARQRVAQITNRAIRDRNFRKNVLRAYSNTCAISGLRLINGGGRAEVEAAHIRPVAKDGPDILSNGLALSGTVHWMFDRGLVGVEDDFSIVVSRQANDRDSISALLNDTGHLIAPERPASRPRREFLRWHRENCFKR